jgi:hypothetical protein
MKFLSYFMAVVVYIMSLPAFTLFILTYEFKMRIIQKRYLTQAELEVLINRVTPYLIKASMCVYLAIFCYLMYQRYYAICN